MKKLQVKRDLINSIIPLGMLAGCLLGIIIGFLVNPDIVVYTLVAGAALGLLSGTVVYAIYSKDENH